MGGGGGTEVQVLLPLPSVLRERRDSPVAAKDGELKVGDLTLIEKFFLWSRDKQCTHPKKVDVFRLCWKPSSQARLSLSLPPNSSFGYFANKELISVASISAIFFN